MAAKNRVPPNDEARLALFCAAVDQYEDLATSLPIVEPFSILHGAKDGAERWTTALHAMVLRKFFATEDELHLVKVLNSIQAVGPSTPAIAASLNRARGAVADQRNVGGPWTYVPTVGEPTTFASLAFDDLYGGLLHGDYGRWLRSTNNSSVSDHVMWD